MDPNNPHSLPPYHPPPYPQPPPPHHLPPPPPHFYPQPPPPISYPPPGTDPYPLPHPHPQPYEPSFLHHHSDKQDINTIFVSGLPDDVKPREIHNLFRRRRGFDFCQMKYTGRGKQVVAFATFLNHQAAMEVLHTLNGATFDPRAGTTLHIELARSNSRPKRLRGTSAYYVIDKRAKSSGDAHETSSNDGDDGYDESLHTDNPISSNKGGFATAQSVDHGTAGGKDNEQSGDRPACSTLFIANLGPNCTDEELKEALSVYPGFHIVKMRANRGMPVAFADFEETDQATEAMQGLQGRELPSSDRGGMHIEYARSKMRKI